MAQNLRDYHLQHKSSPICFEIYRPIRATSKIVFLAMIWDPEASQFPLALVCGEH